MLFSFLGELWRCLPLVLKGALILGLFCLVGVDWVDYFMG